MNAELELQMFLASRLPEKIEFIPANNTDELDANDAVFIWRDGSDESGIYNEIADTEWLAICAMVEEGLSEEQWYRYGLALRKFWNKNKTATELVALPYPWFLIHASWPQRAQALKEVLG